MDKQQWNMDDLDFDRLLEEGLPEEPPDSIAQAVTPWRRAMRRILWGLALNAVTFQFFGLQYWLPLAGVVLVLAAGVGIIVVSVVKIVYLYRTGKDYCVSR